MAQYDTIGTQYDVIKKTPFNKLEQFNFRKHVEPFLQRHGTKVLDLACGTGFYSSLLLEWGASFVVGVDISSSMVNAAKARLAETPYASRARFVQGNGIIPQGYSSDDKGFDVVSGAWFLNYASNPDQLASMFRTISTNLNSHGVFIGICLHPTDDLESFASGVNNSAWAQTGVHYEFGKALPGGIGFPITVFGSVSPDSKVEFGSFYLKKSLYEQAARVGGMTGRIVWRNCEFLDETWREEIGLHGDDDGWRSLQEYPLLCTLLVWKE
ncbi:hypothetical protein J3458_002002 [Metarhizium acridum]|uniref:ToxA protein n=1 Tax=Metarhizium acridum (strain CQMa 102) TaxID=655827 RepID=E9DST8_METAQ|nr:toxA protein [Metarhizium acridum CQMa 102]EFY93448.1 toxA protein [Metarhizium acridum CQMa 102]KAG8425279.1 hypothetical protein J3458_002002 [Metarhizium acridum]